MHYNYLLLFLIIFLINFHGLYIISCVASLFAYLSERKEILSFRDLNLAYIHKLATRHFSTDANCLDQYLFC